ncbi:unknown [Candidatus Colimorpha enterica]|uniref:Uncharacterized protein n=1 Tax=Candidatus Colimorpha enterica TaxID=3083063 RepID=R6UI09_9BACT|nr:unknown [Candidatus Colimorpha enterica]
MRNAGVAGELILRQQSDDLRCRRSCLRNRFGDILRSLAYTGEIDTRRRAFDGTELRMSLGEEIVCVHACGKHGRKASCRFVRLDGSGKNDHVCVDLQLFAGNEVGCLNSQLAVGLWSDLADHALDVMHAVFLDRAAVELIKVLSGSTHVDVEHVNVGVRVLLADEHRVLCGVHTADLGAITLSPAVVAARTDALNKHDGVRVGLVGGTEKRSAVRTCRVHKSFKLKGGDNVLALGISIFLVSVELYRVEAGRNNDRAVFFLNKGVLLFVIDSSRSAYLCADSALAVLQHVAVIGIDDRNLRHCLGKRNIDRAAVVKPEVESVRHLLLRALFGAGSASGTFKLVNKSCFSLYRDREVSDKSLNRRNLAVRIYLYLLVLRAVDHFRGQNAGCAVERREGLVKLSHLSADCRLFFDDIDLKSRVGNVKRRLDTGDTSADNKRTLHDRAFAGGEGGIEADLCNGGASEDYCLLGCRLHVLMYPRVLLSDVRDLDHVGVEACGSGSLSEGRLMHSR